MTTYGKITHFDKDTGTGMIAPMDGSDAVPFMASGMAQEPRSDETYTFDTQRGADGRPQAVNLRMDSGTQAHGNEGGFDTQGQSQQRHNQEAERRSGVDGAGLSHGGGEARDSHGRTEHQSRTTGQEGVSRGGMDTARGEAGGGERADRGGTSAGGSTFQPLEAEESKAARSPEREHELGRDPQGRDERAINEQRREDRRT